MQTIYIEDSNPLQKSFRIATSACLALVITGILFLMMQRLIAMEPPQLVENIIRLKPVVLPEQRDIKPNPKPPLKKPVEPPPEPHKPETNTSFDKTDVLTVAIAAPVTIDEINIHGAGAGGAAMAVFKVAPPYPRRAMSRNIEGYVDLMFDIAPSGKTENIRVIRAQPKGYFEAVSIRTLAKWKYRPALDDGVAVAQKNQTTRITYELEK